MIESAGIFRQVDREVLMPSPKNQRRIVWFYDMNATKNPAGVTRHAMSMRQELLEKSAAGEIQLALCTGRISHPDILALWQRWEDLPKSELPLTARNMMRLWRLTNWPPLTSWSGPADWIYAPAEFYAAKGKARLAVTSHDTIQDLAWQPPRRKAMLEQLYARADLVLSVSAFNTVELLRHFPGLEGRIAQVPNAPDAIFSEPASAEQRAAIRSRIGLPAGMPFLLSVANFQPRKNLAALVRAASKVPEVAAGELALVLVGEGSFEEISRIRATIRECNQPKMLVQITDYMQGDDLRATYAEATALVFPSLCESFGIPALEAMTQDCPLVLADSTCLPEIAGNAALYFDPTREDAITAAINQMLASPEATAEKVKIGQTIVKEYSWKNSVEKFLEAIDRFS